MAEPTEAAERRYDVRHHGRRCGTAVRHVRHGSGERAVRSHGHSSAGHQNVSGDRLPSGRRVHFRPPVPQGVRAGARLFYDGRLAGLLDGVPDVCANDALVENGVRAVRPGGVRTRGQRAPRGGGQEPRQRTTGELRVIHRKPMPGGEIILHRIRLHFTRYIEWV